MHLLRTYHSLALSVVMSVVSRVDFGQRTSLVVAQNRGLVHIYTVLAALAIPLLKKKKKKKAKHEKDGQWVG